MHHRIHELLLLVILLLAGGALPPPAISAMGTKYPPLDPSGNQYLIFTSEAEGPRCTILQMDALGNMTPKAEYDAGGNCPNINASPDGRVVAVSGGWSRPTLNVFFIGEDGAPGPPVSLNVPRIDTYSPFHIPVAFHHSLPLFYAGFQPISCYCYSLAQRQVALTSNSLLLDYQAPLNIAYSPTSSRLTVLKWRSTPGHVLNSTLQTVPINPDGSFGSPNPETPFLTYINNGTVISPDGRWAVALTAASPHLQLMCVNPDGSSTLTQQITFQYSDLPGITTLAFTPDSRGLLMANGGGPYALRYYELDPDKGQLIFRSGLTGGQTNSLLALTPDGRYVVFGSISATNLSHDTIYVARVHLADWSLELLANKQCEVDHHICALGIVPLPQTAAGPQWALYE